MSNETEATPAAASTLHPAHRQQILNTLASHMAALNTYESKAEPGSEDYEQRKEDTKLAKAKILDVSRLLYDWPDLDEGPRLLLLETVEEVMESVEEEKLINSHPHMMKVASLDLASSYFDFFNSITVDTMSVSLTRLPSPTIIPPTTNKEALEAIDKRRQAYLHKDAGLKDWIHQERAKMKVLIENYSAGECLDTALHKRIAINSVWLGSVIKNYNAVVDDHQAGKVLTDTRLLQSKVREIERRQLAVEVALQQGPDREIKDSEQDAAREDKEVAEEELLPAEKLFRVDDASMERIELDDLDLWFLRLEVAGKSRQNTPLVGFFIV